MLKKINGTTHVTFGNTSIPIYEVTSRPGTWRSVWKDRNSGKRKVIQRSDKTKLIQETEKVAEELDKGLVRLTGLSRDQLFLCQRFLAIDPDLDLIVRLEKEAALKQATVQVVFDRFIEEKSRSAKSSIGNTKLLRIRLKNLLPDFGQRKLVSITTEELDEWLFDFDWADNTKIRTRATVMQFFRWAKSKGYLDTAAEAENMFDGFDTTVEIKVYSPEDLWKMLSEVRPEFHPWLVLRAYAGLRECELFRKDLDDPKDTLRWEDIDWERKEIIVGEKVAKTGQERVVDINEVLLSQIEQYRGQTGYICTKDPKRSNSPDDPAETTRLGELTGNGWIRNGLRKSHITYAVALNGVSKTADLCGNSHQTIKKYYQKTLESRKHIAEEWFKPIASP